jgi:hypothetical protein
MTVTMGRKASPVGSPWFTTMRANSRSPLRVIVSIHDSHHRRIVFILGPMGRVVEDVFRGADQFILVADDVFVKIALPDGNGGRFSLDINALGDDGFESRDEGTQGSRFPPRSIVT